MGPAEITKFFQAYAQADAFFSSKLLERLERSMYGDEKLPPWVVDEPKKWGIE